MSDLIGVTLNPEGLRVTPGDELRAVIEVQNAGRVVDAYSIEVQGLDPAWYSLGAPEVSLFPGDSETVDIVLRSPIGSDAAAGSYELTIRVTSSVSPSEETTVRTTLEVEPVYAFEPRVRPERVTGAVGAYSLTIANTGNAELTIDLEGSDPE